MSGYIDIDSEQLCYVRCNNCSTVLAVSVPWNSSKVVTVKCGHCTDILWVNIKGLELEPPLPLTLGQASSSNTNLPLNENQGNNPSCEYMNNVAFTSCNGKTDEATPVICKAPEKRHRVPSAYNCFIKEEIRRIKAGNPDISHKQAFSTAAKNWALFPYMHIGLALDDKVQDQI